MWRRLKPAALILFSTVSDTSLATGYTPQRFGEHTTALSPVHQLDAKMPPVLAFHGDADKTVPLGQARVGGQSAARIDGWGKASLLEMPLARRIAGI